LLPLQVVLKKIIIHLNGSIEKQMDVETKPSAENVTYVAMVVSFVPTLLLYLFIQKRFVKGVIVVSIKD